MRRWTAFQGEPKPTPNPATTEDPTNSSLRCGKWLLRSTKIQRSRDKYTRNRTVSSIFVVSIGLEFFVPNFLCFQSVVFVPKLENFQSVYSRNFQLINTRNFRYYNNRKR
ncbi:hypothetical protein RHMOL_Rhmol07G0070700 [Rhododendron molle]|uniref:Uncharacterized protein n=1 Tax=Rhododendron molle TaxID=49168 RepID=A0ACC0MYP2_RHOML|nr:hypothetical protein RHMOL_Rhmol07G0070700 [Rhododendron molle]